MGAAHSSSSFASDRGDLSESTVKGTTPVRAPLRCAECGIAGDVRQCTLCHLWYCGVCQCARSISTRTMPSRYSVPGLCKGCRFFLVTWPESVVVPPFWLSTNSNESHKLAHIKSCAHNDDESNTTRTVMCFSRRTRLRGPLDKYLPSLTRVFRGGQYRLTTPAESTPLCRYMPFFSWDARFTFWCHASSQITRPVSRSPRLAHGGTATVSLSPRIRRLILRFARAAVDLLPANVAGDDFTPLTNTLKRIARDLSPHAPVVVVPAGLGMPLFEGVAAPAHISGRQAASAPANETVLRLITLPSDLVAALLLLQMTLMAYSQKEGVSPLPFKSADAVPSAPMNRVSLSSDQYTLCLSLAACIRAVQLRYLSEYCSHFAREAGESNRSVAANGAQNALSRQAVDVYAVQAALVLAEVELLHRAALACTPAQVLDSLCSANGIPSVFFGGPVGAAARAKAAAHTDKGLILREDRERKQSRRRSLQTSFDASSTPLPDRRPIQAALTQPQFPLPPLLTPSVNDSLVEVVLNQTLGTLTRERSTARDSINRTDVLTPDREVSPATNANTRKSIRTLASFGSLDSGGTSPPRSSGDSTDLGAQLVHFPSQTPSGNSGLRGGDDITVVKQQPALSRLLQRGICHACSVLSAWLDGGVAGTERADRSTCVVVDVGSSELRMGQCWNSLPQVRVPCVTGVPKYTRILPLSIGSSSGMVVGAEALQQKGVLRLSYPVHRSAVIDWPQYQCIWSAAERKVPLDSHDLVVAGCSDLLQDRAKLTSFLFDDFNVSSMRCVQSSACVMLDQRKHTGVVVDIGHGRTTVAAFYAGCCMPHASRALALAGQDVTEHLISILRTSNLTASAWCNAFPACGSSAEFISAQNLKHRYARLELSPHAADRGAGPVLTYELPDGSSMSMRGEPVLCTEILIDPRPLGREQPGLPTLVHSCISACPVDVQAELSCCVIVVGGSSSIPGLAQRLTSELRSLGHSPVQVIAVKDPALCSWRGASEYARIALSSSGTIPAAVTQDDFRDRGPQAIMVSPY